MFGNEHVKFLRIPIVCFGNIEKRTDTMISGGNYGCYVETPTGPIPLLLARLAFNPGCERSFREGDPVTILVEMNWSFHEEKFIDVVSDGRHLILGKYHPLGVKPDVGSKNVNTDVPGTYTGFLNETNDCGMVVEDNGAVGIHTNALVSRRMQPRGWGPFENSDVAYAQNHHRVISNMESGHIAREHFGLYRGKDAMSQTANMTDPSGSLINIAYRRFVPQNMLAMNWVATNEGANCPWVGPNNEVQDFKKSSEIIYHKVINYGANRITVSAGAPGSNFFNFRVDTVTPKSESMPSKGPECTPPAALNNMSLSISATGELTAEFGVTPAKQATTTLKIGVDGSVILNSMTSVTVASANIKLSGTAAVEVDAPIITLGGDVSVGGSLEVKGGIKAGGKALATADVAEFVTTKLATFFGPAVVGAPPVPLDPAGAAAMAIEFGVKGIGTWQTDKIVVVPPPAPPVMASLTLPLKST